MILYAPAHGSFPMASQRVTPAYSEPRMSGDEQIAALQDAIECLELVREFMPEVEPTIKRLEQERDRLERAYR